MWSSYHSVSLHETTKEAMAFITEWGQYCYCCAPMRFPVSGDAYTRQFDDITSGYLRAVRLVDDSLLWDFNIGSSFWYTFDYLRLSADNRVVFNRDKFQFAQEDVSFAGFEMTREGYKPFKKIITAIKEFPVPTCITVSRKPTIIYFCQGTHHGTVLPAIVCKNIYLRLHFRRTLQKIQGGDRWPDTKRSKNFWAKLPYLSSDRLVKVRYWIQPHPKTLSMLRPRKSRLWRRALETSIRQAPFHNGHWQ